MKKSLIGFVFLLFGATVSGQSLNLIGSISGLADEGLTLTSPPDWFGNTKKETIPVVAGAFNKDVILSASGWLTLTYKDKDRSIYVWKNASALEVQFEADFLDSDFSLKGESAAISSFSDSISKKFGSKLTIGWLEEQAKEATNIDAMEMETFRLRNDAVFALEKFGQLLPEEYVKAYKNHLGYHYYLSLFKFSEAKSAKSNIPKATEIPKVLLQGITWERMNKASELDSEFFRELLIQFVNYKALETYDFMKFGTKESAVQEGFNLARENLQGASLQYFLTASMLSNAQFVQPSLLRQMQATLKATEGSTPFVEVIMANISERLDAKDDEVELAVSEQATDHDAIDLELEGLDGKSFKLSDLKGKVVYLDIWASWCGPCRKEFPAAKALKEKLSKKDKKNIEFLYISIDNTETVWKMAIKELEIEGVHGISKGGWGSEATAKFGVHSIPRYLIFDKKGKVVDGNAPRASDPRLLEMLRKLAAE